MRKQEKVLPLLEQIFAKANVPQADSWADPSRKCVVCDVLRNLIFLTLHRSRYITLYATPPDPSNDEPASRLPPLIVRPLSSAAPRASTRVRRAPSRWRQRWSDHERRTASGAAAARAGDSRVADELGSAASRVRLPGWAR